MRREQSFDHLAEQFKLSLQVRDMTTQANEMVILIRELKKQMDDRLKKNQDAALRTAIEGFGAQLTSNERQNGHAICSLTGRDEESSTIWE